MKKTLLIAGIILIAVILTGCELVKILNYKVTDPTLILRDFNIDDSLRKRINGQEVDNEEQANLYPVAIMIENAADSWPLSGVDKADLVIEAITEASITRFVAFYASDKKVEKIGPVRSARPYYLDWVDPFEAAYMHVGGSPDALQKIKAGKYDLVDLNQFWQSQYFWRDTKWRYAPHNVYTSSDLINQAIEDKELDSPKKFTSWKYKKDKELIFRPETVEDIIIYYSTDYYKVNWEYNREENNYIRYQAGSIQKMTDGEWIKAKNIVVQVNDMIVLDNVGRKRITTLGEGKARIFRDGETIEGKWVKKTSNKRTKYFDNDNNEIEFNGGMTWVQVIPDEDYLRY
jgi:DUF3048 family protein